MLRQVVITPQRKLEKAMKCSASNLFMHWKQIHSGHRLIQPFLKQTDLIFKPKENQKIISRKLWKWLKQKTIDFLR